MMDTVKQMYPVVNDLISFLSDCYLVFDSKEVALLDAFIKKYETSDITPIKLYVDSIIRDYEYVKNCIIHSDISNGPTEGHNNRIKMLKRRSFGRAGIELINAYLTLEIRNTA